MTSQAGVHKIPDTSLEQAHKAPEQAAGHPGQPAQAWDWSERLNYAGVRFAEAAEDTAEGFLDWHCSQLFLWLLPVSRPACAPSTLIAHVRSQVPRRPHSGRAASSSARAPSQEEKNEKQTHSSSRGCAKCRPTARRGSGSPGEGPAAQSAVAVNGGASVHETAFHEPPSSPCGRRRGWTSWKTRYLRPRSARSRMRRTLWRRRALRRQPTTAQRSSSSP